MADDDRTELLLLPLRRKELLLLPCDVAAGGEWEPEEGTLFCSCSNREGFLIFTRLLISCSRFCMSDSRCFMTLYR